MPNRHWPVSVLPGLLPRRQFTPRILQRTMDIADIVIKMRTRFSNTLEMLGFEQRSLKTLAFFTLVEFPISKRQRRLESVLDLPPIPEAGRFFLVLEPVALREFEYLIFGEIKFEARISKAREAALPDLYGGRFVEFGVVEADVDTGPECFVECADAVGSKDYNTGKVF